MNNVKITTCLFIAAATLASTSEALTQDKINLEKCYGVTKAGKNDCASASGLHSCSGMSKKDGDKNEWILVPKGLCNKLVGGSVVPGK